MIIYQKLNKLYNIYNLNNKFELAHLSTITRRLIVKCKGVVGGIIKKTSRNYKMV